MKNKTKVILSYVCMFISLALLIAVAMLLEYEVIDPQYSAVYITVNILIVVASTLYFGKVDYDTGIYTCRECGHKFKPAFRSYIMSIHTINSRRLKCPECGEKSWCIRTYN